MKGQQALVWLFCCSYIQLALAIEQISLSLEQGEWQQTLLSQADIDIAFTEQGLSLTATAQQIDLPAPIGKVTQFKLRCPQLSIVKFNWQCSKGLLVFSHPHWGDQQIDLKLNYQQQSQQAQLQLNNISVAGGSMQANVSMNGQQWQIAINSQPLQWQRLLSQVKPYISTNDYQRFIAAGLSGKAKANITLTGIEQQLQTADIDLSLSELAIADEQLAVEAEGINSHWQIKARQQHGDWQWKLTSNINSGQSYRDPVYIDFEATPVKLLAQGSWSPDINQWHIEQGTIEQKHVLTSDLALIWSPTGIKKVALSIQESDAAVLYEHWLQPFLYDTAINDLGLTGQIAAEFNQANDDYQLQLGLSKVDVNDSLNRFKFEDISGQLAWTSGQQEIPINLSWQRAELLSLPMGQSQLNAVIQANQLKLNAPWYIPLLDGQLDINQFELVHSDETLQWQFAGALQPISMPILSQRLGWPEMEGKLSGVIPKVSYQDQQIQVDGALQVNIFEGTSTISNLRLADPFGAIPQLYADIDLDSFDLETMTKTFDFGDMTGTVSGQVANLRLANWQPVVFDGYLETPEDDKVPHKISQRAINNLSSLGGGASGVLSRSVLRFFENFSYQKIGVSCKLRNDICQMSGVEQAQQGYYIVKGGGLPPTIDVIGHNKLIDWPELIARLKAVSNSQGPVIQ